MRLCHGRVGVQKLMSGSLHPAGYHYPITIYPKNFPKPHYVSDLQDLLVFILSRLQQLLISVFMMTPVYTIYRQGNQNSERERE